ERRLLGVLLDQLDLAPFLPLELPVPRDARALRVAEALMRDPGDARPIEEIARAAGASKRTLERLFVSETKMTLGEWRQQLGLLHGIRLLARGQKVTTVALDVGYASPSAFIAMFRRALGKTPTEYLAGATRA